MLILSPRLPPSETPPEAIDAVPETTPATPEGKITKAPVPEPIPCPSFRIARSFTATLATAALPVPLCEIAKSPDAATPPIEAWTPAASNRMYGPAGRFRGCVTPLRSTESTTAEAPVFTATVRLEVVSENPGMRTLAAPENDPANPAFWIRTTPWPFVTCARVDPP